MSRRRPVRRVAPLARASPYDRRWTQPRRPSGGGPSLGRRLWEELRAAAPQARGLLLIRIFFGVTFIYAGLDKLLDPNFFNSIAATSIQAQFQIFERASPLAPLVRLAEPLAVPLGILIALGEIGAGLGALTGLCFRLAALGGAALAAMFYLTASWPTHPYYLGPDLPYMVGWLGLAVAGHGGLWVSHWSIGGVRAGAVRMDAATLATREAIEDSPGRPITRRQVVEVGYLAGLTLFVGAIAGSLRVLLPVRFFGAVATPTPVPPSPTSVASLAPGATATPTQVAGSGIQVATVAAVDQRGFLDFEIPVTAPAALFPGDPAVIVRLQDGSFVAFDAICTHEGCTVSYDGQFGVLFCPCHGAEFDPTDHAKVLQGPARRPLPELPLVVDTARGTISLATS